MFDYSNLLELMDEKGISRKYLCRKLGISMNTFSNKINGHTYFTTAEMKTMCRILGISKNEVGRYFLFESEGD